MRTAGTAAATVAVLAGLALPAAGCGGSPGSHVAQLGRATTPGGTTSASASSPLERRAIAFARCVRSHRVPNWPDPVPGSTGTFDKSKLTPQQVGASDSRIQAAQHACNHLLGNGGSVPNAARLQQARAQGLQFAACVRRHGVPNFPDPASDGRIPDPASVGIDQGSPRFEAANQACRSYRPPYIPSNSAYNAWARTQPGGS